MSGQEPKDERDLMREIGVRNVDNPSAFDLLGVPEACEDDALIREEGKKRNSLLKRWEQYKPNPDIQKMAVALKLRISDAQKRLRTAQGRTAYRQDLLATRIGEFRNRIKSAVTPGEELAEERIRQLAALAGGYGIDEATARAEITKLSRADNPFVVLGIKPIPADDRWPTAFDVLLAEESDESPPDVERRAAAQLEKIEAGLQTNKISSEEAVRLRSYVQEAVLTLSSSELLQAYRFEIRNHRLARFQRIIELVMSKSGVADTTTLVQLVHQGRQMRLAQADVESALKNTAGVNVEEAVGHEPSLGVNRSAIEAYVRGDGRSSREIIGVRNDGTGELEVYVESDQPWIRISEPCFRTRSRKDVEITLLPSRLRPGEKLCGAVRLRSNGGEAEIEVTALLGQPGSEATLEDYNKAAGAYFMGLAFIFLLPFVVLSWRFMMSRKESAFLAFHAAQSMFFGIVLILAMFGFGLFMQFIMPDPASGTAGGAPPDIATSCLPCCFSLLLLGSWIGAPVAMGMVTKNGRNIQIPGIAGLIRRLL
jgi:hypothetical protein